LHTPRDRAPFIGRRSTTPTALRRSMRRQRLYSAAMQLERLACLALIGLLVAPVAHGQAPTPAPSQTADAPNDVVDRLLAQMTLEEKAGQLTQWGAQQTPTGPRVKLGSEADIRRGKVGSFLGAYGVETTRKLQRVAVEQSRLHIPLLFSFDVIHGFRTTFPVPLAEAAAFNPQLAERCARAAAVEATAHGVHWTYAPMVDIGRDPRWGRVVEGAGEDPFLGSALAAARVRGFRGSVAEPSSMLATAKHFAAYGAAEAGRDYNTVDLSERALHEIYLPPFRAALEAGADALMPAFNEIAGTPMHAHRTLLRDVVRGTWGFRGLVVSDYTGIKELLMHGVAASPAAASALALEASVDVDMVSDFYVDQLPALVKAGKLPQRLLDDAVRRVLEAKRRLGLFDDPYRHMDATREQANALRPETRALAREAARASIVLLKNERALLPLKKDIGSLAVIGALAADAQSTLGAWAAAGLPKDTVTVLEGIRRAVAPTTKLMYARGASPDDGDTSQIAEAERVAASADVVVWVAGESEGMSGEAHNRSALGLPGAQDALFARLRASGKPIVVLLMNGRPLAIPELAQHAQAIVETWYLGHEMGHAVADVLFGDVNPSGKLPVTFPRAVGQVPIYYNHKRTGRPPRADEVYTSKYLDLPWTPLYPFGHGLSYTNFDYGKPQLSTTKLGATEALTVRVRVRNTGKRAGDEIVQLYLRDDVASVTRPVRALRGFARVSLAAGATQELTFTLDQDDFALLDDKLERVVEAGTFTVFVGGSSESENSARFTVTSSAKLVGAGSAIPRTPR
jgi:beta-glucosidase